MANEENESKKIKIRPLIFPTVLIAVGFIMFYVGSQLTTYINKEEVFGLFLMIVGSIIFPFALYREIHRIGKETPFPLSHLFPSYPIVEDKDDLSRQLSGFRDAYGEFLSAPVISENSRIQNYSSQLLWHCLFLQKKRMDKFALTLDFHSDRRAYTSAKDSVRSETYFDGRYDVKDVSEEIDAVRSFCCKGRVIKKLYDKEVAHYTLLSAKASKGNKVICPNCGAVSTKADLIDGCDYCGTKFTVEDIENSVASFGFRRDFSVRKEKREAITELIHPWLTLIGTMPGVYFGFFGPFFYTDESNLLLTFAAGLFAAFLFGVWGYAVSSFFGLILTLILIIVNVSWENKNRNLLYREEEELAQERNMATYIRGFDPKFSIQSFFGGVQNKLIAIHYADKKEEINAFSDVDLSSFLTSYRDVVDADITKMTISAYEVKDGMQRATVTAQMILRRFLNGKIEEKRENVRLILSKSAECKSQTVCAPSILTCSSCGGNLSLIEGKKCQYCGNELDLKKFDWVVTEYMTEGA